MSTTLLKLKQEPLSPLNETIWLPEDTLYPIFDDEPDVNVKFERDLELVSIDSKADAASLALEHLENLIDLDELIKEENFLLDEKILPILEEVAPPSLDQAKLRHHDDTDTQSLLKEFENVYETFNHDTLTPPQSPPTILTTLQPLIAPQNAITFPKQSDYPSYPSPLPDIAHELAVVDELVRTRVEDMQWTDAPCSPNSSSSSLSSSSSNFGDCSGSDPEWCPAEDDDGKERQQQRRKPYSRGEKGDKKLRKKEQNKNAATRYRMKKKAEVEVILGEEKELSLQNEGLENKITDMQREIKYLKGLMRDLFKAKGLIN